jgi:branched-chain amino acid transport system permease protein
VLSRTKIGLLIRAGVAGPRDGRERWATASGGCSWASSSPARRWPGLGGVMWGLYQQSVVPQIGAQVNVLIFIVIIIGGLGSHLGCFVGALLVGLMANYTGFLAPKVALFSNIALMVAGAAVAAAGPVPGDATDERWRADC